MKAAVPNPRRCSSSGSKRTSLLNTSGSRLAPWVDGIQPRQDRGHRRFGPVLVRVGVQKDGGAPRQPIESRGLHPRAAVERREDIRPGRVHHQQDHAPRSAPDGGLAFGRLVRASMISGSPHPDGAEPSVWSSSRTAWSREASEVHDRLAPLSRCGPILEQLLREATVDTRLDREQRIALAAEVEDQLRPGRRLQVKGVGARRGGQQGPEGPATQAERGDPREALRPEQASGCQPARASRRPRARSLAGRRRRA